MGVAMDAPMTAANPSRQSGAAGEGLAAGYDEIAPVFDAFAAVEEEWLTRTGAYHGLVHRALRPRVLRA